MEHLISCLHQVDKTGTCYESWRRFGSVAERLRVQIRSRWERITTIEVQLIDSQGIVLPSIVV